MKKVLLATEKPFAASAVMKIQAVFTEAGYEMQRLEKYSGTAPLLEALKEAEALIVRSDLVTAETLQAAPKLRIVVRAGAGYDNIDLAAASARDVVVMNTPGQNSNAVAELALGMMVYMARNGFNGTSGTELRDKSLGIHAFGNVGKLVASIAEGFGMDVRAYDPFIDSRIIEQAGIKVVTSVEELYRSSQYVSLNIPANEKTRKSINYDLMSLMPADAVLVNTARKEIICEESLLRMFADRPDFKYLTDVAPDCAGEITEKYRDRYFATPKKMGAQTEEANVNAGIAAAQQIVGFFERGNRTYQVNK